MALTTEKDTNEIIKAWQSLIEQSVKANTAFLETSAKLFTEFLSKKSETKDLLKINTEVLNAAANNFIKLNITNAENLMNFGVSVSRNFFSFANTKNETVNENKESRAEKPGEAPANAVRNQISLSGRQGEQITTSFYLNSHNPFAQSGKFYYGNFIEEVTGNTANLFMGITPKEFMLEPAKSLKVDISINVAADVVPGKYISTVRLDGMDNQEFDIVVDVSSGATATQKGSKPFPVTRNRNPKKSSPKKKNDR